ncbi:tRNA pseudouridine(38-40) synthase TruA [Bacillus aquiflavi]|uniref:tRNA pseudouridine(38-40) synthase TruA n=1 Tax=Bacillus aquiflavi TaxID=2672567 RepID=UPI001CA8D910|nr:tRNA pseudouridine(38-40) synthase TruA [Bacillus aquiflavi]UAC48308.1 tRNA pseudouridine(38-40) synthase TruA [Bacillus aquiflavi]
MKRYKCTISYDGAQFFGYQIQPNKRTVQEEIEKALANLHKGLHIRVTASGRTDTKVHAKGQVIHFDSPLSIPIHKWPVALNSILPEDITVVDIKNTDAQFHARFDAVSKEYRYFIFLNKVRDPFKRFYTYHFPYGVDLQEMEEASKLMLGTHDFTSFCSAKTETENKVRTMKEITLSKENDMLVIRFVGNGFLYNMVRILVGTLLEVGTGRREASSIPAIFERRDRSAGGKTAAPQGLYLWKVDYE